MSGRLAKYLRDARTFPADARLAWRYDGLRGVGEQVLSRTLHRVFRRGRFIVVEQELARVRNCPPPAGVEIRPLREEDWAALSAIATVRKLDRMRAAAAAGRTCLVAWRAAQPVGYTWISETLAPEIETHPLPLPPDGVYLWDLFVAPVERNAGIGSALVSARLAHARRCGFRVGWRVIAPGNRASLRTLEKTSGSGTRVLGEVAYHKVLGRVHGRFRPTPSAPA